MHISISISVLEPRKQALALVLAIIILHTCIATCHPLFKRPKRRAISSLGVVQSPALARRLSSGNLLEVFTS